MYKPRELKVVIIDNAGFHSLKIYKIPVNIKLVRIQPYSPELNPKEMRWAYVKQYYKNKLFSSITELKIWLQEFVKEKNHPEIVKSITQDPKYIKALKAHLEV